MISTKKIQQLIFKTPLFLGVLILISSCENDIKKVQKFAVKQDSAIVSAKDIEVKYTVNGRLKVIMKAPILNRYLEYQGKSYSEFPKGINLIFFDEFGKISSKMRANYSIYYEDKGVWEAQYDVVAVNEKNERLNTEYLIWYQETEKISTDRFVTMTTQDGIIHGKGFESNQDFTKWEILEGSGIINVEN